MKDLDLIGHKHYISHGRPKYDELLKMLEKSQIEYRSFLDECIKGKLNIEYINTLSEGVSICFTNNPQNIFLPAYGIIPYLPARTHFAPSSFYPPPRNASNLPEFREKSGGIPPDRKCI